MAAAVAGPAVTVTVCPGGGAPGGGSRGRAMAGGRGAAGAAGVPQGPSPTATSNPSSRRDLSHLSDATTGVPSLERVPNGYTVEENNVSEEDVQNKTKERRYLETSQYKSSSLPSGGNNATSQQTGAISRSRTADDVNHNGYETAAETSTSGDTNTSGALLSAPGKLELPGSGDFRSDTTPEAQLLSKFKHVYAGKGGWLGVSTTTSSAEPEPEGAVGGSNGLVRTRVILPPKHHNLSTSVSVLHKRRTMPKTQYERYKKEIMHKLARTLQEHQEDNVRGIRDHGGAKEPVGRSLEAGGDGSVLPPGPVAIPASWRLPVGWAGRNRGFLGGPRERPRRPRDRESNARHQSSVTAATLGRSSGHSGATTRASVSTTTKKDRPAFRRSWLENSFSAGPHAHTLEESHNSNKKDGGVNASKDGSTSYKLRLGNLLSPRDPNTTTDGESSLARPPSKAKTEVARVPLVPPGSANGPDTSRTGVTSQTFPYDNSRRRATYPAVTGSRQQQQPKASGGNQNGGGAVPTSSRGGMNMFSRMSIEAQAALKEMGAVGPVEDNGEGNSDLNSDMRDHDTSEMPLAGSKLNELSGTNDALASHIALPSDTNMPNSRTISGDKENRTSLLTPKQPVHKRRSIGHLKMTRDKLKLQGKSQPNASQDRIHADSDVCVQDSDNMQVPNKVDLYHKNTEGTPKQCSCKVRAGIVLKHSTHTEPSITLRVTTSSRQENGGSTDCEYYPLDGDQVKVTLSQVSRTRLPNIQESPSGSVVMGDNTVNTTSTTPFRGTHRQIQGVGHYKVAPPVAKPLLIKNWNREKTFEITPVGYDSRFEDLGNKEDIDETPEEIKQKAIVKCNDWLKRYH